MSASRKTSSSRGSHEKESTPITIDYEQLLRLCRKYWFVLAGGLITGLVIGYFYAGTLIPIYSATATILVPQTKQSNLPGVDPVDGADATSGDLSTFEQLLQTKDLSERVVKDHHLNENSEFLTDEVPAPASEDTATGMLAGSAGIHIRMGTQLIDISVEHRSPEMAQKLANWMAEESVSQEVDQSKDTSSGVSQDLEKELDRLQKKLADSEAELKTYDASHGFVPGANGSATSPAESQLNDLQQALSAAQAQVTLLKERYGEQHPKLVQAEHTVEELQAEVSKAQQEATKTSSEDTGRSALQAAVNADKDELDSILKGLTTATASGNVKIPGLRVVEEATMPWGPVRPNKNKIVGTGGLIGLLCGMGFILGLYFMDSSVRSVTQAENVLGMPVIAAVPILTESDGRSVLPTFSDPQSFVAESFRGLRASLILHDREHPLKTILVVSAIPGEGKSFCASNLAVTFAQAGLKTLLIDADLRLPTAHTYFKTESSGFTEVLAGRATLESAIVKSPIPTLSLLLTTVASDSPAELLSGIRLPLLLDEAAQQFDRIVIDSAPLNAVSDTMLIMQKADAILLVVRASQTPASESKAALQKISSSNMKPLGLILNYLAPHSLKSYAYGYSYGQKPKEKNAK